MARLGVSRVVAEVGTDGKLVATQVSGAAGTWKAHRQRELDGGEPHGPGAHIAEVTTAVAKGPLERSRWTEARSWS